MNDLCDLSVDQPDATGDDLGDLNETKAAVIRKASPKPQVKLTPIEEFPLAYRPKPAVWIDVHPITGEPMANL